MRIAALPEGWTPAHEPVPIVLLCGRHILNCRLRRLRARHLAISTLHGGHDLCRPHRPSYSGSFLFPFIPFIVINVVIIS